ncbi:DUF4825 domain-containing protein [Bacillus lacus]|uniref:DUF4825 domain-containing protein n=1 Tax=Metabacillus lacus TaxID=1983721 RepID=A0A7X2J066_9BACI|nr:DUF4825 domain-containing protein [Metabacillus lacus]MRX73020.1 DUF4825 domain-containing protein [Metabacillus lacus]
MRKFAITILSAVTLAALISGCSSDADAKTDVFQYQHSYVGDNSAVGSILRQLNSHGELDKISLHTSEKPYGITVQYKELQAENLQEESKETAFNNASYLFTLIQNAEWVTFQFPHDEYTVEKKSLEALFKKKLSSIENEEELKQLLKEYNTQENLAQLF